MGPTFIPQFIFPLENKSGNPLPRKEAFKFRNGIVIVTIPIFSEQTVFECLKKTCQTFGIDHPLPSDILPMLDTPVTQSIEHFEHIAHELRTRVAVPESREYTEWRARNESYFLLEEEEETDKPTFWTPATSAGPLPSNQQEVEEREHIEDVRKKVVADKRFQDRVPLASPLLPYQRELVEAEHIEYVYKKAVDNRPFRDRLVPNAKMEAARRKHLVRMAMQAKESFLEGPYQESRQPTPTPLVLLMRNGKKIQIPTLTPGNYGDKQNRVQGWRQEVASSWAMALAEEEDHEQNNAERNEVEDMRLAMRLENVQMTLWEAAAERLKMEAEENKEAELDDGNEKGDASVERGRQKKRISFRRERRSKVSSKVGVPRETREVPNSGGNKEMNIKRKAREWLSRREKAVFDDLKKSLARMKVTTTVPEDLAPILKQDNI